MTTARAVVGLSTHTRHHRRLAHRPQDLATWPDEALVAAARDGDQLAAAALIERHTPAMRRTAAAHLRNRDEVDDAVGEAVVRILAGLETVRDPASFVGWAMTIVRRASFEVGRGRGIAVEPDADDLVEPSTPEMLAMEAAASDDVVAHLRLLGERDGQLLWLRDALGTPVPELARRFGVTEGSARVLLTRARTRLRASYAGIVAPVLGLLRALQRRLAPAEAATEAAWAAVVQGAIVTAAVLLMPLTPTPTRAGVTVSAPTSTDVVATPASTPPGHAAGGALSLLREHTRSADGSGGTVVPEEPAGDEVRLGPATVSDTPPPEHRTDDVDVESGPVDLGLEVYVDPTPPAAAADAVDALSRTEVTP